MNAYTDQIRLRIQDSAKIYGRYCAQYEFAAALIDVIYELKIALGNLTDLTNQQRHHQPDSPTGDIHNANSSSGQYPKGYEDAKMFLAIAKAYEAAKEDGQKDDDVAKEDMDHSKVVQAKPCGGQPRHPGKSHHAKSKYTIRHTAEMCGSCGSTDLELLKPINKISTDCGEEGDEGKDTKHLYTARVTFGWCGRCPNLMDPAPHLIWGIWMTRKALVATIQYESNPLGRTVIAENLGVLHGCVVSPSTVSNSITAHSKILERRVFPASVVAFVKAKMDESVHQRDMISGLVKPTVPAMPAEPKSIRLNSSHL